MTRRPDRSRLVAPGLAGLVAVALALGLPGLSRTATGQTQTFRSSVGLIAVDVQVTGRDGRPVGALGPENFEVTLDGRKRRVISAEFVRHAPWTPSSSGASVVAAAQPVTPPTGRAASVPPAPGRIFVVAIDAASFGPQDGLVAVQAAQRFINQLPPADAVGVFTLPHGPRLSPTISRVAARQMIDTIVGTRENRKSQFDLTVAEVIDITAQGAAAQGPTLPDQMECLGTARTCNELAYGEAQGLASALEQDIIQGITGLGSLLGQLRPMEGRKTVLLLSAGLPVSDLGAGRPALSDEVKKLGEQAAYANTTVHAVYFNQNFAGDGAAESRRPAIPTWRARDIYTRVLSEFSEPSGGKLFESVTGEGESAIDRLLAEISTYYVLGVEPDAKDRDGRPHKLKVKVGRAGADVQSRELVVVPRPGL